MNLFCLFTSHFAHFFSFFLCWQKKAEKYVEKDDFDQESCCVFRPAFGCTCFLDKKTTVAFLGLQGSDKSPEFCCWISLWLWIWHDWYVGLLLDFLQSSALHLHYNDNNWYLLQAEKQKPPDIEWPFNPPPPPNSNFFVDKFFNT